VPQPLFGGGVSCGIHPLKVVDSTAVAVIADNTIPMTAGNAYLIKDTLIKIIVLIING
jgi:hypothetical protein